MSLRSDRPPAPIPSHGWPIRGQDAAVDQLRDAIANNRVRHSYLFGGPTGVGKSALALAFAAALCCQEPPEPGVACGHCLSCRKIGRGVHPDVQMFSLESQALASERSGGKNTSLTIETVRELSAGTAMRPVEGRWRVVLVDDAETLQEVAQEALLKTLEEPPRFVVLILLSDDPELLLPTIRSRCQLVELRRVPRKTVVDILEERSTSPDRAEAIAAVAGGLPGLAIHIADNPKLLAWHQERIERSLTWMAAPEFDRVVTAVRLGDTFTKRRAEILSELELLLGVWRDALLLHASLPTHLTYRGIAERLHALASGWTLADLYRGVCSVRQCLSDLEANVRPRLALEAMVLQWPTPSPARS